MRNPNDEKTLIPTLTVDEAQKLIQEGVIKRGMIPKVDACLETVKRGVRKVHIIDGRLRHSLLLEIFSKQGIGTELVL